MKRTAFMTFIEIMKIIGSMALALGCMMITIVAAFACFGVGNQIWAGALFLIFIFISLTIYGTFFGLNDEDKEDKSGKE